MNVTLPTTLIVALIAAAGFAHDGHHPDDRSDERRMQPPPGHRAMEIVDLPEPTVSIRVEGEYRVITSNSLPDHPIGTFPNPHNPNALRSLNREFRIPLHPRRADRPTRSSPEFGIALNGIIFDAGTGEFWTASGERGRSEWNYDAASANNQHRFGVDFNHGHVQPTGKYHYHGVPTALLESRRADHVHDGHAQVMIQLGWAFDGFPVYAPFGPEDPNDPSSDIVELSSSYRLRQGHRPAPPDGPGGAYDGTYSADYEYVEGVGDLDASNGRTGVTPEFPDGTYYYVITDAYPSVPRTWVGTPGPDVARRGPGRGPRDIGPPPAGDNAPPTRRPSRGSSGVVAPDARSVNPAFFIEDALAAPIVTEERTLADGTKALCYVIRTYSEPQEHEMGPWAPTHIEDGAEKGGIWLHEGEVHDVDGPFVRDIAEFYDDPKWRLHREDGSIRVTDTKEAFEAAARPDVDPRYNNHVVEGRPEWLDRNVFVYVIPVQPSYQKEPTFIGRPRRGSDRGARLGGPPPRGRVGDDGPRRRVGDGGPPPRPRDRGAGGPPRGGPGQTVLGIAFNGVNFEPPAPVDAILAAYTLAPFDDAGGHINPHNGYHYHAVTGHTKEIAQPDGHAPMIGYAMDGYGLFAHTSEDGSVPTDLDECGGHSDGIRGYHYHAGAAGENRIIRAFRGIPGTMSVERPAPRSQPDE
ncbi:MAG: YHYH protein [Acidimicrobiia bacterium]|nr:YHYH protein [Acidimicrobiia bacterium]